MSSASFDATIDLAPRPSARAVIVLFGLHAVPLALMLLSLQPGVLMAGLAFAMGGSWFWLRRHSVFGYGPKALIRLTWHQEGVWTLHQTAGVSFEAELQDNSLVHPLLLVLNFRLKPEGRRTRVLLGDELEEELLRRLRARLSVAINPRKQNSI